ncbi:Protein of unknown function (DUF3592) [Gulbenkiania indica]|uniref:DUF3592 domain-containing protein n=1 Tax=Gulbenkiania indica TaxID=375574 RepID=A0A0K6H3I7_9NEIS|nr:DUF3592 domain-containing protein [Gulbenkiania indica]CUA85294.1 Protein of unknown function (DUF3592) [Gulbenkiania indica]
MIFKLLAWLGVLAGLAGFVHFWRSAGTADAATRWPTVSGIMLESALEQRDRQGGDADRPPGWRAVVRYRYTVNNQTYESTRRRFPEPGFGSNRAEAEAVLTRYPVGGPTTVHYNPANPAEACLEPGDSWPAKLGRYLALAVAAVSLLFALSG